MGRSCLVLLPLGLALAVPLAGQAVAISDSDIDRFQLFTECAPIGVSFALIGIEDTEPAEAMAETRLRAAGLYGGGFGFEGPRLTAFPTGSPYLSNWQLGFRKWLVDPVTGLIFWATTWSRIFPYGTGPTIDAAERSRRLEADLSGALDDFIRDYLRVNEEAC